MTTEHRLAILRAAGYLAAGSAVALLASNAVSQILLGAAILALLISRERIRFPPIALPLALFFLGTLIALALSPDPLLGLPQIKKFYVFLILPLLYTVVTSTAHAIKIVLLQTLVATASALWSFVQFWHKRSEALSHGWSFYDHYVANRATGFMGHWMAFSGQQMIVFLLLFSLLIFGAARPFRPWLIAALLLIGTSIAIAWTRSVWGAAAVATVYLIAVWRPRVLMITPLLAVAAWFVAPSAVRERALSIFHPHGETDSNLHRWVTFRTGMEMIKAHPWFGLGPDMQKRVFNDYIPPDIPRPLPSGFYGHLHNVYLQYAADRGIPTLLALLWFIGKCLRDFIRAARRLPPSENARRALLHGAVAATLAVLMEAFFEYNLGDSEVLTLFLITVAMGYIAARDVRQCEMT